ncbi:MAG: calcium-binding protein, partial [Pseudomonadota bacterium]
DPDTLRFIDNLRWTDFDFLREGASDTLTLQVSGTTDGVILTEQLKTQFLAGYINRIETLVFADGTEWSYTKLFQHFIDLAKTDGDDVIYGFDLADVIDGGAGNDQLIGFGGSDTYKFARGYGEDTILDAGGFETLVLEGISSEAVTISRTDLDLIFTVNDTGDRIVIENQYVRAGAQAYAVESFAFADRTVDWTDLNPEDVDLIGTSGDDILRGSNFREVLDGRAGDDLLEGGSDGDTYMFDVGYGSDTIIDVQVATVWEGRRGREVEVDDRIRFGADITVDNVRFAVAGDDLIITVQDRSDTLTVKNQFRNVTDGIELFEFYDGTIMTIADVEAQLDIVGGNRGDNIIDATPDVPSTLDGRQGDDILNGGSAGDTYAFGIGYDFDTINEVFDRTGVIDKVIFGSSVTVASVVLRRDEDDLLIDLGNGEDVLRIVGGLGSNKVEEFSFADGTVWTVEDVRNELTRGTDANDKLVGFDGRNDDLSGGAGSDELIGRSGNDTYRFGIGDGRDSVEESSGVDRVVFGTGVTSDAVAFSEVGDTLVITLTLTGETLAVLGGLSTATTATHVESFEFDDGITLSLTDIRGILLDEASNASTDLIDARTIDPDFEVAGGYGYDTIIMGRDTRVLFAEGDGIDRIELEAIAMRDAVISFTDYGSTEAVVRRAGLESDTPLSTAGRGSARGCRSRG